MKRMLRRHRNLLYSRTFSSANNFVKRYHLAVRLLYEAEFITKRCTRGSISGIHISRNQRKCWTISIRPEHLCYPQLSQSIATCKGFPELNLSSTTAFFGSKKNAVVELRRPPTTTNDDTETSFRLDHCISKKVNISWGQILLMRSNSCRYWTTVIYMLCVTDFDPKGTISEVRVHGDPKFGHTRWSIAKILH